MKWPFQRYSELVRIVSNEGRSGCRSAASRLAVVLAKICERVGLGAHYELFLGCLLILGLALPHLQARLLQRATI